MSLVRLSNIFDSSRAMTTSESVVCLLHSRKRQYSSNIQRILNLLRVNIITIKCDLNSIAKRSLCTCFDQLQITDEKLIKTKQEFDELKIHPWFKEVNEIIQINFMKPCHSNISLYKLFKLICKISNENKFSKITNNLRKEEKVHSTKSNLIRRCIELNLSPNQIGHLLGRDGHFHKQIMADTNTQIHFDNAPYSIKLSSNQCPEFDLDLFESSSSIKTTITGDTLEAVENAIKALKKHDRDVQDYLSHLNETNETIVFTE